MKYLFIIFVSLMTFQSVAGTERNDLIWSVKVNTQLFHRGIHSLRRIVLKMDDTKYNNSKESICAELLKLSDDHQLKRAIINSKELIAYDSHLGSTFLTIFKDYILVETKDMSETCSKHMDRQLFLEKSKSIKEHISKIESFIRDEMHVN